MDDCPPNLSPGLLVQLVGVQTHGLRCCTIQMVMLWLCCVAGFQTHTTPVLLNAGERAELATEQYIPLSPLLEGFVILRPNPNYVEPKS